MSTLIVPVVEVSEIMVHPSADRLEIINILGWQVVVKKGTLNVGDKVVYFPPDTVLPQSVSDEMGVTPYLSKQRVRAVALRGEPSFGFVQIAPSGSQVGDNLADLYGCTKYISPLRLSGGDTETDDARFLKYTDIENLRNFPQVISEGESVCVTEKIHGTNARVAYIDGERMAGSHNLRRKEGNNVYWMPFELDWVQSLLGSLSESHKHVILFGEIYGAKVQKGFSYDVRDGVGFRIFDIMVDGNYLDFTEMIVLAHRHDAQLVPVLRVMPFSIEEVKSLANGKSTIGDNIREGVVIRPVQERRDPKIGRVILKYISDSYLLKDKTVDENEDE